MERTVGGDSIKTDAGNVSVRNPRGKQNAATASCALDTATCSSAPIVTVTSAIAASRTENWVGHNCLNAWVSPCTLPRKVSGKKRFR